MANKLDFFSDRELVIEVLAIYLDYLNHVKEEFIKKFTGTKMPEKLERELHYAGHSSKQLKGTGKLVHLEDDAAIVIKTSLLYILKEYTDKIAEFKKLGATSEMLEDMNAKIKNINEKLDLQGYRNVAERLPYIPPWRFMSIDTRADEAITQIETLKVMISSTINDLNDERNMAEQAIKDFLFQQFRAEKLPPASKPSKDVCEDMARKCDLFLLIIGSRYGYVPPGWDVSVTEFEYNTARDADPTKILVFVKDRQRPACGGK